MWRAGRSPCALARRAHAAHATVIRWLQNAGDASLPAPWRAAGDSRAPGAAQYCAPRRAHPQAGARARGGRRGPQQFLSSAVIGREPGGSEQCCNQGGGALNKEGLRHGLGAHYCTDVVLGLKRKKLVRRPCAAACRTAAATGGRRAGLSRAAAAGPPAISIAPACQGRNSAGKTRRPAACCSRSGRCRTGSRQIAPDRGRRQIAPALSPGCNRSRAPAL